METSEMKESTYLRIFHNWKRGKDTVLNKYKYSILYAPFDGIYWFIRANKNNENWGWYKPCPDYILTRIDPTRDWFCIHPCTLIIEDLGKNYDCITSAKGGE